MIRKRKKKKANLQKDIDKTMVARAAISAMKADQIIPPSDFAGVEAGAIRGEKKSKLNTTITPKEGS